MQKLIFMFLFFFCFGFHKIHAQLTQKELWQKKYANYISDKSKFSNEEQENRLYDLYTGLVNMNEQHTLISADVLYDFARLSDKNNEPFERVEQLYKISWEIMENYLQKKPTDKLLVDKYNNIGNHLADYYLKNNKTDIAIGIYKQTNNHHALKNLTTRNLVDFAKNQIVGNDTILLKNNNPQNLKISIEHIDKLIIHQKKMNQYSQAIESCKKTLAKKILLIQYKPDSIELKQSYINSCVLLYMFYTSSHPQNTTEAEKILLIAKDSITHYIAKYPAYSSKLILDCASVYHNLGMFYAHHSNNWQKAEDFYKKALEIRENNKNVLPKELIYSHNGLCGLYDFKGDIAKSEFHLNKVLELCNKYIPDTDAESKTYYMGRLGNILVKKMQYHRADSLYAIIIPWLENHYGKDNVDICIGNRNNWTATKILQAKYKEALTLAHTTKQILESSNNTQIAMYLRNEGYIAHIYNQQGLYYEALKIEENVVEILKKIYPSQEAHPQIINAYLNLAITNQQLENYQVAYQFYELVRQNTEKTYSTNSNEYALICKNIGIYYINIGSYQRAKEELQKSIEIYSKRKENLALLIETKTNLAIAYRDMKMMQECKKIMLENIKYYDNNILPKDNSYYENINLLASLYSDEGKPEKAIIHLEILVKNFPNELGRQNIKYINRVYNLANAYIKANKIKEADEKLTEIQKILEITGKHTLEYAKICSALALVKEKQNQLQKAEDLFQETTQNIIQHLKIYAYQLSTNERNKYYQVVKNIMTNYGNFVVRNINKTPQSLQNFYNYYLNTKNILFTQQLNIQKIIHQSNDKKLQNNFIEIQNFNKQLTQLYQSRQKNPQKINKEIRAIEDSIAYIEKMLFVNHSIKNALQQTNYTWQNIQKKLQPNECVVDMIKIQNYYLAIIINPLKNQFDAIVLENGQLLNENGKYFKHFINSFQYKKNKKFNVDTLSYQYYWQPIANHIKEFEKIYFVSDGIYHYINPYTFYNPYTKKYLVESETHIIHLSSARDILLKSEKSFDNNIKTAMLIGNPIFKSNKNNKIKTDTLQLKYTFNDDITRSLEKLDTLPKAGEEINAIKEMLSKKNVKMDIFTKENAKENYLKAIKNADILHIVTHGFYLKNDKDTLNFKAQHFKENSLLKSWLFLAGCQDNYTTNDKEDNILTAYEASQLSLSNTVLAVLSACETGMGVFQESEGVANMQKAFQQAGAKNVLMSLYNINDNGANAFMQRFYENFLTKKNYTFYQAIKSAQKDMLLNSKFKHPYYWGAFILVSKYF